jgi:hypothetical protein
MIGNDRGRLGRDGSWVNTPEKQVYRTRISPKLRSLTIAQVRYQPDIFGVTLGVTEDARIELPP